MPRHATACDAQTKRSLLKGSPRAAAYHMHVYANFRCSGIRSVQGMEKDYRWCSGYSGKQQKSTTAKVANCQRRALSADIHACCGIQYEPSTNAKTIARDCHGQGI